ncbi:AURKAIP1/COX24 domain-containing protein [Flavivirga rizhaonensis]|uniref:AURKAIP1/COX24 domain-containing protein n=1 Tax=Flavivirga rizhaonensis TaxID=2559571 RepID=A0A4S1E2Q0_9FLAO|nr:AURKAIP1/COX24 domain-containing protein [Flavivirga rizhaonensis]
MAILKIQRLRMQLHLFKKLRNRT